MFTRPIAKILKSLNTLRGDAEDCVLDEAEEDKATLVAAKLDDELAKLTNSSALKKQGPEAKKFIAVVRGAMRKYYESLPTPVFDPEDRMEETFLEEKKRPSPDASSVVDVASDADAHADADVDAHADADNEDALNPGPRPKKSKKSKKSKVKESKEEAE